MATFVRHEPCPRCGSRDNLGRYSDNSAFCFGCNYTERGDRAPWIGERDVENQDSDDERGLRLRGARVYPAGVVEWLGQYAISTPTAIRYGWTYDDVWEQLLFPLKDENGAIVCIQAKNFNPKRARKAKYYNTGDKNAAHTYYSKYRSNDKTTGTTEESTRPPVILTEDILSAVRVGEVGVGFPLLGTSIPREKLAWLKTTLNPTRLVVWLDQDKWREGRSIADAAKLLGLSANTLLTPLDPKCYSVEQIQEFLK